MTEGAIWRHIMNFALPTMVGLIFQQLYNTVDTIIVGQFVGKEALSVLMVIFAPTLLRLFSTEADVLEYGIWFVRIISPFYILTCFTQAYSGSLRGVGKSHMKQPLCGFPIADLSIRSAVSTRPASL